MLQSVTLKFTERASITIPAQGITIFVGPNNSGKSLVLREIERAFSSTSAISSAILENFELIWPSIEDFQEEIAKWKAEEPRGTSPEVVRLLRRRPNGEFDHNMLNVDALRSYLDRKDKVWFSSQFFYYYQMRLDGRTRFDLTNDRPMGDLIGVSQNTLAQLFKDDELREEIRAIAYDAFGLYFVIDPTLGGTLRIRLSKTSPTKDEQSLNQEARDFHSRALYIKDASDGVQAFIGILIASRSSDYRLLLVDEPEAFLHPPLARKLGYELARDITKRSSSLFASTHSADFLIGCLQASANVRVVRLEYSDEKSRATVVDAMALNEFFRTPLIRNANVISALFHDGVVVTESDNDRVFYSEIYHRISESERGCPSLLFVNAQNKQTDLSPNFHPVGSRIRSLFGPVRSGVATGRGAKPSGKRSAPACCGTEALRAA
jgi:predicted ATPase